MNTQNNKETVKSFMQALGQGDVEILQTLLTDDAEAVCTGTSVLSMTRDRDTILKTAAVFPLIAKNGIEFSILELTAEEDRVSCDMIGSGELVNGTAYNNEYHFLFYFRDGKICRFKEYLDTKQAEELLVPLLASA